VSPSDDEKAQSNAQTTRAVAEADARKLELARNRLEYTTLRASQDGVVTSVKFEVGQVVAEGQPIVSIAKDIEPEIVVNVPEDRLAASRRRATRPR
jgi:multidrug resistance efflux pump